MGRTQIVATLTAILALALGGCTPRSAVNRLDRADSLVVAAPDSALAILDSIDPTSLHSAEHRARYALLTSYGRYRTGHNDRSDSLISIATSHFTEPTRNAMLAHFTHGFILKNDSCYLEAVDHLLRSEKIAIQLRDSFQLAMIYRDLGEISYDMHNLADGADFTRKAADYLRTYSDSSYYIYAMSDVAVAENNVLNYSRSIQLADSLFKIGETFRDTTILATNARISGIGNMETGHIAEALTRFKWLRDNNMLSDSIDQFNYIYLLVRNDRIADAKEEIRLINCKGNVPPAYWVSIGNYKEAYHAVSKELAGEKKLTYKSILFSIGKQRAKFMEDLAKERGEEKSRQFNIMLCVIILLIMLSMSGVFAMLYFKSRVRLKELELFKLRSLLDESQSKQKEVESLIAQLRLSVRNSEERVQSATDAERKLAEIIDNYFDSEVNFFKTLDRFKNNNEVSSYLSDHTISLKLKKYEAYINLRFDKVIEKFKVEFTNYSEEELALLIYTIMRFPPRIVSLLTNIKTEVISNRKTRMKKKIAASNMMGKEMLLTLF